MCLDCMQWSCQSKQVWGVPTACRFILTEDKILSMYIKRIKYWVCMWMVPASPVRWYIQRAASMCTSLRDRGGWWCCLCVFLCVFLSVFASWCVLMYKLLASQLEGKWDWKNEPRLSTQTHGLHLPWPVSWHRPLCSHQRRIPTIEAPNVFLAGLS